MARRDGLFARMSLDYADHPKIAGLSDAAFRAHVEMILYSRRYLTDGVIAKQIAKRWPQHALSELQANDPEWPSLIELDNGDYLLHGFEEMQETRAEVEKKRQVRAEAGRLGGLARQQKAKQPSRRKLKPVPSNLLSKNEAETETETETEIEVVGGGRSGRKRPNLPLPDDWTPTDLHKDKAEELGIELNIEAEKFRNHAISKDRRQANWNMAFSNWLIQAHEFKTRNTPRGGDDLWSRTGNF